MTSRRVMECVATCVALTGLVGMVHGGRPVDAWPTFRGTAANRRLARYRTADIVARRGPEACLANSRRGAAAIRVSRSRENAFTRSATPPRRPRTRTSIWSASTKKMADSFGKPRPGRPGPKASPTGTAHGVHQQSTVIAFTFDRARCAGLLPGPTATSSGARIWSASLPDRRPIVGAIANRS